MIRRCDRTDVPHFVISEMYLLSLFVCVYFHFSKWIIDKLCRITIKIPDCRDFSTCVISVCSLITHSIGYCCDTVCCIIGITCHVPICIYCLNHTI